MASPYDVAIKLSLVSNVAEGIAVIIARLARAQQEVRKLEEGLKGLRPAILGAVGAFAGFETFKFLGKAVEHGKELSHELSQIQKLNESMTPQQFEQIRAWASGQPSRVPGTTMVGALKGYGAIQSMFGQDEALKMGDTIAKFGQVLGNQKGNWDNVEDQVLKMIRAGDLLGKFTDTTTHKVDIDKLQHFLDLGTRVINATHGMVNPQIWFSMAQTGGAALSNMTDEGLMAMAMAAQGMGGYRAGTAMTSLYQQMIGGKMTQYAAQELQDLGLVGGYSVGSGGHVLWDKGALNTPFATTAAKNPLQSTQIMQDALIAHGFDTIEKQVPELFKMLSRQTTQRLIHDFLRNYPQMTGELGRLKGGMGVIGSANLANSQDAAQGIHNLTAAYQDMLDKIDLPVAQGAIPIMKSIGDLFVSIGTLAATNPKIITGMAQAMTALGAALTVGGAVSISSWLLGLSGIVLGWPVAAAAAAVAAIAALVTLNYDAINKGIHDFSDSIRDLGVGAFEKVIGWIRSFGNTIEWLWNKLPSLPNMNLLHPGSYEGGGFGGGGVQKASWGGGGASGSDIQRMASAGSVSPEVASIIRASAIAHGVDPTTALAVAANEGARGYRIGGRDRGGDGGLSGGVFQLYTGGGEGNRYQRETGRSPFASSRADVQAQVDYAMRRVHQGGWGPWHGARDHGIGAWQGIHRGGRGDQSVENHHHHIYMDGTKIATAISKRLVRAAQYPTSVGRQDGHGTFMTPGAEVFA